MGTTVNTCATRTMCIPFTGTPPAGATGILSYQSSDTPASTETVTDDQSNTWTCGTPTDQATDAKKINICTTPNLAANTNQVKLLFSGATTNVSVRLHWFYNTATSSITDGTSGNTGTCGSVANDCTAGSFTPTIANDFIYTLMCRTQTPAATSFTEGSAQANTTHELITTDKRDGCADQWGVQTVAGAINPQMTTTGTSTRYAAKSIAIKSGAGGSAPTGMYVRKIQSWSTPTAQSGTTWPMQFTSKGNLLFDSISCGGSVMVPSTVTDSVNGTWNLTGGANTQGPQSTGMPFIGGAIANTTGLITQNTTGTGDCTFTLYDVMGAAASSPFTGRQINFGAETSGALTTLRIFNLLPGHTSGMTFFTGQFENNTAVSFNSPAAKFNAVFYGGEAIDGPNPMYQNGPWGYFTNTSNALSTWTLAFADNSIRNNWVMEADSFMSASGSTSQYAQIVSRVPIGTLTGASATLAITVPAITAGDLLVVAVGNNSSRNITSVCTDGGTCAGGNAFTQATAGTGALCSVGTARGDIWYLLSAPAGGSTTITVTYAVGTAVNREAMFVEVRRPSGSWAIDTAAHVNSGTGSGLTLTGATMTTSGSTGFGLAYVSVGNTIPQGGVPAVGNEFMAGGSIFTTTTNAAATAVFGASGSHIPVFTDSGTSDSFCMAESAWK